ncbi:MAG: cation-translocating P-type ATPase [Thermodesulfovibrionia bacterium]|nr:cation-translocating P-type ATPase [Thermodesulfovibrionia bacterium]
MAKVWHSMEAAEVLKELDTDLHKGLTEDVAKRRIEKYGYNELKKEEGVSPFTLFINQFKNILIIILLVAIALSALVGEVVDAAIIGVIVIFCAVLGFVQEYRAERALDALKKMLSPTITVLRGGKEEDIPSKELVPGDILLLEAGDKIPADARLVENHSLRCDEAPLTGESVPVGKDIKPLPEDVLMGDRKNTVFTGTTVTYGRGKAVVTSTGMNTEFGKIAEEVTTIKVEKTPLEKRTEEVGKWLGIIAVGICVLVAGISIAREAWGGTISLPFIIKMMMFAIALAVAAVPEALAAIVTGALAIGMHQMAKKGALVRKMPAVETLGCTTVICSDKTGTLTKGEMTVRKIFATGRMIEVTGAGYAPVGEFKGSEAVNINSDKPLTMLLRGGILCNDSDLHEMEGKWFIKGDPTEGALVVAAAKAGMHIHETRLENPRIEEIPFSSERKRMTTIHQMQDGKRMAFMKGAPEIVLERCSHILDDGGARKLTEDERACILRANEGMAQGALRVLGVAYRELPDGVAYSEETIESDMAFLGLTGMMDPPREEAIEATRVCKEVGIKPVMITGDHKLTAVAVANEIGIYKDGDMVLTGDELSKMSEEELEKIVDKVTVYARVSPMDKLKIVKAWKDKGEVVAMTGDGVNDAPALKHADIGIAMGISGTEVTKEAADMVLTDDNFATIVMAIERGRWIYDNIKKYLAFLIQCNITEVVVIGGVVLAMGPEFLPLLPAAILYMNLATDGLPALALGVAPPDPDIMQRPPRNPKESVFSWDVKAFILRAVLIESPFFFILFFYELKDITHARTEIFFLFVVIELVIALNCRSLIHSIFKAPPHKWLLIAITWEIVLIAVLIQIPSVREAFGIMKPSFSDISIIVVFGLFVFAIIEVTKVVLRKKMQAGRRVAA